MDTEVVAAYNVAGSCPNCGAANSTYFGDILTVKGNREKNEVQCGECKAKLKFDAGKRQVSTAVFWLRSMHHNPNDALCLISSFPCVVLIGITMFGLAMWFDSIGCCGQVEQSWTKSLYAA